MANDKLLLNDGSSFLLLNDGSSTLLLNSETAATGNATPIGLLLALTVEGAVTGGNGTPLGLLLALTVTGETGEGPTPPGDFMGGRITAHNFTRKRWRELQEAWKAQLAAESRAEEVKDGPKRRAFEKATKLADYAILLAEADNELNVTKLKLALEAAAGADTLTQALVWAKRAEFIATRMIEDEQDEDDVIMLILSQW